MWVNFLFCTNESSDVYTGIFWWPMCNISGTHSEGFSKITVFVWANINMEDYRGKTFHMNWIVRDIAGNSLNWDQSSYNCSIRLKMLSSVPVKQNKNFPKRSWNMPIKSKISIENYHTFDFWFLELFLEVNR